MLKYMDLFRIIDKCKSKDRPSFIYISLDTIEGSSSVGHWIWECSLFLPYIKDLVKDLKMPFKILLKERKNYKINILSDFGYSDIVYSDKMASDGETLQEQYVIPSDEEYIMYLPKFFYLWNPVLENNMFLDAFNRFRNYYVLPDIVKTTPISYIVRSRKENYLINFRHFVNMEEFIGMINMKNINIIDVDNFSSLKPQFEEVLKSKIIILEMGSVFAINAALIASDTHVIVINDTWGYNSSDAPFFKIFRKLMKDRNNTVEIFDYKKTTDINAPFSINIQEFSERIDEIRFIRNECVVCTDPLVNTIASFPKFPIMAISNSSICEEFYDCNLAVCNKCKCLQLRDLVDPSILYSDIYMNSTFSPSWTDHHEHFCNFIFGNTDKTNFLEVGANKGDLYKLMIKDRCVEFTALDMWKHDDLPSQIKYIEGNCETFDFKGFNTIILSHVFEHLYKPLKFIENIRKTGVSTVFISIPDFDSLVKEKSLFTIYSQHTFYCGFDYIVYMFSLFNYRCESSYIYNGNLKSVMFKFILDTNMEPAKFPSTDIQLYKNIYVNKVNNIRKIEIPPNSYIAPSGIYGQFYYNLLKNKGNVVGFLDNNKERHGKPLYGTDKLVYLPSTVDYKNVTVIVCDCPYKKEIIAGLKELSESINIISIDMFLN